MDGWEGWEVARGSSIRPSYGRRSSSRGSESFSVSRMMITKRDNEGKGKEGERKGKGSMRKASYLNN